MNVEQAPTYVGLTTLAIGAALVARPDLLTERLGLDATAVRVIGLSDLVLVPGLLKGEPRWPWMAARAAMNVAVAAYLHPRSVSKVMLGLTVVDGGTALALRQAARA
jgi:hypothetical protein